MHHIYCGRMGSQSNKMITVTAGLIKLLITLEMWPIEFLPKLIVHQTKITKVKLVKNMKSDLQALINDLLNDPQNIDLKNRVDSYQFKMSQKILAARVKQGISQQFAAKKAKVSYDDYLNYERGLNVSASKEEYTIILRRIAMPEEIKLHWNSTQYEQQPESIETKKLVTQNADLISQIINFYSIFKGKFNDNYQEQVNNNEFTAKPKRKPNKTYELCFGQRW